MAKPKLRRFKHASLLGRLLVRLGLLKQLEICTLPEKPIRPARIFRFKCRECGSERDVGIYRINATQVKCVCGGIAIKGAEQSVETLAWWYRDGEPFMQDHSYKYLVQRKEQETEDANL